MLELLFSSFSLSGWRLSPLRKGELDSGEECDDLNILDNDGRSSTCLEKPIYSWTGTGVESALYVAH